MTKLLDTLTILAVLGGLAFVIFGLFYIIFTGYMSAPDTSFIAG
jgi:hypothetical protein